MHQRQRPLDRRALREHFEEALQQEIDDDGPPVLFEDGEDVRTLVETAMGMLEATLAAVQLPERVLHVELPFRLELRDPETGEALPMPLIGLTSAVMIGAVLASWVLVVVCEMGQVLLGM